MIPLEANEVHIVTARKHWITYLGLFLGHGALFVVLMVAMFFMETALAYEILASCIWVLATSFTWFFIVQYLDTWRVTDKRIVAIDQIELFSRSESNILISKIQDVQWKRSGVLQEFFGYGTLTVQSAGVEQVFVMKDVANVAPIAQLILEEKAKLALS